MAIAIIVTDRDVSQFQASVAALCPPGTPVWVYPDIPRPDRVEMAVVWKHPPGILSEFPSLKLVSSFGAGLEHILAGPPLPPGVRICRIVDEQLVASMRNYVLLGVLHIHKRYRLFEQQQHARRWAKPEPVEVPLRIGILGLGELGSAAAQALAALGFEVWGYSRRPRCLEGVRCLSAADTSLLDFARRINLLVCLLPHTPATAGILNLELFRALPAGACLINAARGAHLQEEDLLQAMREGQIREAWLDVFQQEPLPPEHPFWAQEGIFITPHIASITNQDKGAEIAAENYRRLKNDEPLLFEASREEGY
jgi:glyoxylate/hydroxypyruvate reductase A